MLCLFERLLVYSFPFKIFSTPFPHKNLGQLLLVGVSDLTGGVHQTGPDLLKRLVHRNCVLAICCINTSSLRLVMMVMVMVELCTLNVLQVSAVDAS